MVLIYRSNYRLTITSTSRTWARCRGDKSVLIGWLECMWYLGAVDAHGTMTNGILTPRVPRVITTKTIEGSPLKRSDSLLYAREQAYVLKSGQRSVCWAHMFRMLLIHALTHLCRIIAMKSGAASSEGLRVSQDSQHLANEHHNPSGKDHC